MGLRALRQALLSPETSAREAHGGEARIRSARFPTRKTLEEFDFTFQRSVKKQVIERLGQLDFLHAKDTSMTSSVAWIDTPCSRVTTWATSPSTRTPPI